MGREVKRVRLDFDWPIGVIWPGGMGGVCSDDIEYCFTGKQKLTHDELCEKCKHAARLAGLPILSYGCPQWEIDPLPGEGWQMWETVSEGSPISPVFKTPEELARWLTDTHASACGSLTATYEQWLAMIQRGWAPSMVSEVIQDGDLGSLKSGVQFIAEEHEKKP